MNTTLHPISVGDWFESCAYSPEGEPLAWDSEEAKNADPESRQMFMLVRKTAPHSYRPGLTVWLVGSGDMGMNASDIVDYDINSEDLWEENPYHRKVDQSVVPEDYRNALRRYAGLE